MSRDATQVPGPNGWPGVFIKGDSAIIMAQMLQMVLSQLRVDPVGGLKSAEMVLPEMIKNLCVAIGERKEAA